MFLSHIHNFRAYAIVGIVGAHTLHAFQWHEHPEMFRFFDTLFNQSSVLFFFIAGFMFQYLSGRFEKWNYWKKKARNVILPYLLLSIPSLYYYTMLGVQDNVWAGFYDNPLYLQVFYFLITGKHLAPFWFVPTIALFYIVAPLLIRADRDRRIYWLLPLFMIISFYLGRGGQYGPLNKAAYLFSVYLFGMFASVYHDQLLAFVKRYQWVLLAAVVALILGNLFSRGLDQYFQYTLKVMMCPLLLYYLDRAEPVLKNRFSYLAHISFGIFFIHAYVLPVIKIMYLRWSGHSDFPEGNLISYLILTAAVTLGCMLIIFLCQKVAGRYSRMLLGA